MAETTAPTRIFSGAGQIAEDEELTETTNKGRRARAQLLARQLDARLVAEGLSVKARQERRAMASAAVAESAARRSERGMRHRPGYTTAEARQPFKPGVRLIRSAERSSAVKGEQDAGGPTPRPTFAEMRAETGVYPMIPLEVRERQRVERQSRRRRKSK